MIICDNTIPAQFATFHKATKIESTQAKNKRFFAELKYIFPLLNKLNSMNACFSLTRDKNIDNKYKNLVCSPHDFRTKAIYIFRNDKLLIRLA